VLVDPPYDLSEAELEEVLQALVAHLAEEALVVVERSVRSPRPAWPTALRPTDDRRYGETVLWFAVREGAPGPPDAPTVTA
jgi:16S rRNA (guanine966-N2)-methyltransferase